MLKILFSTKKNIIFLFLIALALTYTYKINLYMEWLNYKISNLYVKKIIIDTNGGNSCKKDPNGHNASGLGNQFFMFAMGYTFAKNIGKNDIIINNMDKCDKEEFQDVNKRCYALDRFSINYPVIYNLNGFSLKEKNKMFNINKLNQFKKYNFIFKLINSNNIIKLSPYLAYDDLLMYDYFKKYSKEIKNIIKYKEELSSVGKNLMHSIKNTNSVSLHIRRGDFVEWKCNMTLDYHIKAVYEIVKHVVNPVFFIFTDDVNYVKQYFKNKENFNLKNIKKNEINNHKIYKIINDSIYVSEKINSSLEEFHLMSNCKHNIIPNSTFSWWAAFLNQNPNKIIISPRGLALSEEEWLKVK